MRRCILANKLAETQSARIRSGTLNPIKLRISVATSSGLRPEKTAIERILGEEVHNALSGLKSDKLALADAALEIDRHLQARTSKSRF